MNSVASFLYAGTEYPSEGSPIGFWAKEDLNYYLLSLLGGEWYLYTPIGQAEMVKEGEQRSSDLDKIGNNIFVNSHSVIISDPLIGFIIYGGYIVTLIDGIWTVYKPQEKLKITFPLTYLFSGESGFDKSRLRQILSLNGFTSLLNEGNLDLNTPDESVPSQVTYLRAENYSNKDICPVGFDKRTYYIKAGVHNMFEFNTKKDIVDKATFHQRFAGNKFIAKTWDLFSFNWQEGVWIIRPSDLPFCAGKDIRVVSTKSEFDDALIYYKNLVSKRNTTQVIISEYFKDPVLFEGRKFHIRLYWLVRAEFNNVPFLSKILRSSGEILTAALPYQKSDFGNTLIHDTHGKSTPKNIPFPEEFPEQNLLPQINNQLDELEQELNFLAKNMKPYQNQAESAYEIFALDVMVLKNGQIKVLEINDRIGYMPLSDDPVSIKYNQIITDWEWTEGIQPLISEWMELRLKLGWQLAQPAEPNTYLFSGYSGFDKTYLKEIFDFNGFVPALPSGELPPDYPANYVPEKVTYLYVNCKSNGGFDTNTFKIKTNVHNILDSDLKQSLVLKSKLHDLLEGSSFIAKTQKLFNFKWQGGVWIIRPSDKYHCSGEDIKIVSNQKELQEASDFYKNLISTNKLIRDKDIFKCRQIQQTEVIISEYFVDPLLFEGRKFHLRLYMVVIPHYKEIPFTCKIVRKIGKILTAKKPYQKAHWDDPGIHDTHLSGTDRDLIYPEDFPVQDMIPLIDQQLDYLELILGQIAKNFKPFVSQADSAYEIFGLDLMVLKGAEIKLLEVNDRVGYDMKSDLDPKSIAFNKNFTEWEWTEIIYPLLDQTLNNKESWDWDKPVQTYLFSGDNGFDKTSLINWFNENDFSPAVLYGHLTLDFPTKLIPEKVDYLSINSIPCVVFDQRTYSIKTRVHNILDTKSKKGLVLKAKLHENLKGSPFIAKTEDFFKFVWREGVWIIRPSDQINCGGTNIRIISNQQEYNEAIKFYKQLKSEIKNTEIIISEYFIDPLLFEGRKFHLRLYMVVIPHYKEIPFTCKIVRRVGKILTAKKPYQKAHWDDPGIHDTHLSGTDSDLIYPEDFPVQDMIPFINQQLDRLEKELSPLCKDFKPFVEQADSAYEIFGLDLMVMKNGEVKLLEVNDQVGYGLVDPESQKALDFNANFTRWEITEAIYPLLEATK